MGRTLIDLVDGSAGDFHRKSGVMSFDNSYTSGGEIFTRAQLKLSRIEAFEIKSNFAGFGFETVINFDKDQVNIKVYSANGGSTVDPASAGTPTGSVSTPTFTGDVMATHGHQLNVHSFTSVAFTGNPFDVSTVLGSVPYNHLNVEVTAGTTTGFYRDATIFPGIPPTGMFCFDPSTQLLEFNPADGVTTFSFFGVHRNVITTSAGTPSGTVTAPTFSGQTMLDHTHTTSGGGGGSAEVAGGTNLSVLTDVRFEALGY
jgi:hypothetical protein